MLEEKKTEGLVIEILRMSTEDGPGIRTTVFLKGCSLSCIWCHNPESISLKPQVHWINTRCIGCSICVQTCKQNALNMCKTEIEINRQLCIACGDCTRACPTTAMELLGTKWTAEDLAAELAKDKSFFDKSGGGVTIGGGESTLQPQFVKALLEELNHREIHTAIDTCAQTKRENLELFLPICDLVLLDIKEINSDLHKEFTGAPNEKILKNAKYISSFIKDHLKPKEMWVRTPLIPGATASIENIKGIGSFIVENLSESVIRWELLAFNNLCEDKYIRLGMHWKYSKTPLITEKEMAEYKNAAIKSGVDPSIIQCTGSLELQKNQTDETNKKKTARRNVQ